MSDQEIPHPLEEITADQVSSVDDFRKAHPDLYWRGTESENSTQ